MNWVGKLFNKLFRKKEPRQCVIHGVSCSTCRCGHSDRVTQFIVRNIDKLESDKVNIIKVDGIYYKVKDVGGYYG